MAQLSLQGRTECRLWHLYTAPARAAERQTARTCAEQPSRASSVRIGRDSIVTERIVNEACAHVGMRNMRSMHSINSIRYTWYTDKTQHTNCRHTYMSKQYN